MSDLALRTTGNSPAKGREPLTRLLASCRRSLPFALLVVALLQTTGCRTVGYYSQALKGQYQIVSRQEPIPRLVERSNTPAALKEKLTFILDVRQFAEQKLGLPADGHYLKYADLGRRYAVWNVFAAPEFSLEAKSWWYPVVGGLDYRGFFSEELARKEAARLRKKGYDVHVGGIVAYSTLGWFRDPVLNTFVFEDELELAELLFHELAHQKLFVPGDTDFNEAFATAVAEEAMRRWLRFRDEPKTLSTYEGQARRAEQFARLTQQAVDELELLYDRADVNRQDTEDEETAAVLRENKKRTFERLQANYEELKATWGEHHEYDGWFRRPMNNALLNTVKTYYQWVPAFRQLLHESGGDLELFYKEAEKVGKLKKDQREERLKDLVRRGGAGRS